MPQEGSQVTGSLISVSPKELQRIDEYEDFPEKYQREQIRISDQLVWVYVKGEEEKWGAKILKTYAKYILKEGSTVEKRELMGCFELTIKVKQKIVTLK